MKKGKWIRRGVVGLVVLYAIYSGSSRQIQINKLAHTLRYGVKSEKLQAANDLMVRDRLYDEIQQMPRLARIKAVDTIEQIPGELTIKQCLLLLKDSKASVRKRVTRTLTILGKDHVKLFVPALKDSDENVRNGAKGALVGIGPKVIPDVKEAIIQPDLRVAANDVLLKLGEASVPAFIELLREGDQDVRMTAADSLGKIGSKKATPALMKATHDIQAVRRIAISSLCTICDPASVDLLVEVLGGARDDGEVRARTARALSVIGGSKAVAALVGALDDWDLKVRTSAISGLQRIGAPAVNPVMAAMSSGSKDVRRSGAAALERIDSPESASALVRLVGDSDPAVRASAARGLGAQSGGAQFNLLISLLSDKDGGVADAAADSLVSLGNSSVPSLMSVLRSASSDVAKYQAADALARIGSPAVTPLLSALGTGGEPSRWAAYALGRTKDPRARPALERFAASSDPEMAWVVKRALGRL